jgi:hypothetical protein
MIRWLLSRLFGPRCDFGTSAGCACWRRATYESVAPAPDWDRALRWCEEHATTRLHRIPVALRAAPSPGEEPR